MDFATWAAQVKADGGVATVLPPSVPDPLQAYVGQPAARYSNALYATLFNAGQIDPSTPQVAAVNGAYVYVLAPFDVATSAPHTMTLAERAENAVFTAGDAAANAAGLPSLADISDFLKDMGKQVVVGVGVTLAIAYFLRRKH